MAKSKNDFASIGDLYGGMLNGVKQKLVSEGKLGPSVKPGEIGESPLIKGGPQTTAGYMPAKVDKKTMSKKDIEDNLYNIDSLSYDEDEETKKGTFTKVKKAAEKAGYGKKAASKIAGSVKAKKKAEEDEEELVKESGKIAKERLNNFMRRKSIFDKLYENVMQPGGASEAPMGGEMDDTQELDALGIEGEDELGGEGEDEVTFTLDRATAEKLHEVLMSVLGAESDEDAGEGEYGEDEFGDEAGEDMGEEAEEGFWDEDEEDLGHPIAGAKEVNMGKNNKVGNLKVQSGGASSAYTSKVGPDGDHGHALVNAKQPNMGKSNKVGGLKTGKSVFEQ
jgi:hypothetical protein